MWILYRESIPVRSQTTPPYFINLFLLVLDPLPEWLDLSEQHHKQSQVLVDSLGQGSLVGEANSQLWKLFFSLGEEFGETVDLGIQYAVLELK